MVKEIVNKLKDAEKSAKELVESRKKKNQIELEEAVLAAKERLKEANQKKASALQNAIEKADKEALLEIEELKKEYDLKIANLGDIAKKNLSNTVKFVIDKI